MAQRNRKPEFAVIGLGRFGLSLALTLIARGYTVLGIDRERDLVQQYAEELTQTVALEATDADALRAIDIASFDAVVVAIGSDFESNVMTTVELKALGVRHVVCKALSERQQAILLKVGADRVVLPEHEAGQRLAYSLIAPLVLEQLPLGSQHTVSELRVPSEMAGQTVRSADLRGRFGVTLLAVKRDNEVIVSPTYEHVLGADDLLVVVGANEQVARLSELD